MTATLTDTQTPSRIVRRREVLGRLGISEATLWRLERAGQFPRAFRVSKRAVGYDAAAVEAWVKSRAAVAA
jgi:prophage regulatory protein